MKKTQDGNLFPDKDKQEKVKKIIERLYKVYPKPYIELDHKDAWELLVATMCAAQCTDKLVNTVTPALFKKYPTVEAMAKAPAADIDSFITRVTFHINKSKNIKAAAEMIVKQHSGKVPDNMEELDALPGVARKTANVVLNIAYKKPEGIVIDTHGIRLSHKLGLSEAKTPEKIEQDLMEIVPKDKWIDFGSMITLHGRHKCVARPHDCTDCPLGDLCPEYSSWHK